MKLIDKRVLVDGTGPDNPSNFCHVVFFGDMHVDEDGYDPAVIESVIESLKTLPNAIGICVGDVFSLANQRTRKQIRAALETSVGGETAQDLLDKMVRRRVDELTGLFDPVREKLLVFILGNHSWATQDGQYSDQLLSKSLNVPFCEGMAAIRLTLGTKPARKKKGDPGPQTCRVHIVAHHGIGGGMGSTIGGDLNSLTKRASHFDSDIFAAGHSHMLYAMPTRSRLVFGNHSRFMVHERNGWVARCGSAVRAYGENSSYAEKMAMAPATLGYVIFKVWIKRVKDPINKTDVRLPGIDGRVVVIKD